MIDIDQIFYGIFVTKKEKLILVKYSMNDAISVVHKLNNKRRAYHWSELSMEELVFDVGATYDPYYFKKGIYRFLL